VNSVAMRARVPDGNRKPGVCYAVTKDGVELPVIDVTHPAFALELTSAKWRARLDEHLQQLEWHRRQPVLLRRLLLRLIRRNSVLLRGVGEARGTFLTGMNTYLMKLGPENLGCYAGWLDRRVAGSFPALALRARLEETARSIASHLAPALAARSGPLHLINVAGGPATDSLNALVLLRRQRPEALADRCVRIHVLDLHDEAPTFGARAVTALRELGAPLHGLEVGFEHVRYDWRDTSPLRALLSRLEVDAVVAGSSEGGLFHYGSDDAIVANLQALRDDTPEDFVMTGSLTWESVADRQLREFTGIATRAFEPGAFHQLVERAGWMVDPVPQTLSRQVVALRKRPAPLDANG
jgi:hypothetical protein